MVYLTVVLLTFSICIGYYYRKDYQSMDTVQAHVEGEMINFSEDSGMYNETVTVSLTKSVEVPGAASIYYTLDGDDPTVEKTKYTGSIHLEKKKNLMVYPLKAVVYYGGEYSEVYEKTYVVCDDISNEFDLDIISITSDRENLYDYETGILVKGKTYYENYAMDSNAVYIPGNYSRREKEWIRNAHATVFDSEGMLRIEQNIGLGVSGGTSSEYEVKSLKLYADGLYDGEFDKFYYNINNEELEYAAYSFVNNYNSIRLRSGSQDREYGNIRSSIVSRVAQLSGADHCTATKRCIVYLNGEYYGLFDIQQNYSNSYLANRFDLDDSESIEKIKGNEASTFSRAGISDYFSLDLNDANNRQILERYVDMDNYLLYYAINVLCNNTDWPDNNYEIWRYTGEYDERNQYSDGRYRFLIYDTDSTFSTELSTQFLDAYKVDTFAALMDRGYQAQGSVFSNVMASTYYRDKFVTIISDLLNTSFSWENIMKIIREEDEKLVAARKVYHDDEFVENAEFCVDQVRLSAMERPGEMENLFANYFGMHEKYQLDLHTSGGVAVTWNNMHVFANSTYRNQYYKDVDLVLEQETYPGYTFQYWLINGEKVYDSSLAILDEMTFEGIVSIQAIAKLNDSPEVIISEISAKGSSDWIRISNVGNGIADLKGYYISDKESNMKKYQLPDISLASGESIKIYGSKNHETIGDYICNFSLNEDETLYLSNEEGCIYDIPIPKMSDIETYGRYDNSNIWMFLKK